MHANQTLIHERLVSSRNLLMASEHSSALTIADLYQEYQARLYRYAVSLTRDMDPANDLVQETLIKAMAHLDLLNRLNVFQRRAWLYQVLKNLYLDQRRARLRMDKLVNILAELGLDRDPPSPTPAIAGILHQIPGQYREVLEKRHLLGMTSEEIGKELGIPAATVRSRLRLAIQWMRANQSLFT